jgi:ArsR family transcriptional regulator
MELKDTVTKLTALAHESRLAIYRLLVVAGADGLPAGKIAEQLELPGATASFHLKELHRACLLLSRQVSRFIYYSANYAAMTELISYLTENCCGGVPCETSSSLICKPLSPSCGEKTP